MDRPNYRRSRKGESVIICHQKNALYSPRTSSFPRKEKPQPLGLDHTVLREELYRRVQTVRVAGQSSP